jgi:hypothetical protein
MVQSFFCVVGSIEILYELFSFFRRIITSIYCCYYCSKEIFLLYTEKEEEEENKLKGSVWFCSDYCKDAYVNIQINKKGERKEVENDNIRMFEL